MYRFIDEHGSFELEGAENDLGLYFPLAGEDGLKSAVSPNLSGDSKLDQNHFLLEPMSIENLTNNRAGRNFWCMVEGKEPWSAVGASARQEADRFTGRQEPSKVRAGLMWHEAGRESAELGISAKVTSFVSIRHNVEVMHVEITNTGNEPVALTAVAAIPLYGRSADNLRDHRHVTSLLNRIVTTEYGVHLRPTLSFDERGHGLNDMTYFVEGFAAEGEKPQSFYPCQDDFWGAGGTPTRPEALCRDCPGVPAGRKLDGQEALGGLRFAKRELRPQESVTYTVLIGAIWEEANISDFRETYMGKNKVEEELELTKQYWIGKANVHYHTADKNFDQFMSWVSFQPELRRIFGCSFLPHHDYGRGGRGWRDLWQDCLALLLMNPSNVRQMLIGNFGGVRLDGSNATIIGDCLGEFKADRNSITRVWMDHGVWPCVTTMLYLNQTGDYGILYQKAKYFKDRQVMRGTAVDEAWNKSQWQEDVRGHCYEGTVLEHLLVQMLTAFYEVGEHNHMRLRDADWNDALDMAGQRGESVAFTNAYAMNMNNLAAVLRKEAANGVKEFEVFDELVPLLTDRGDSYGSVQEKTAILHTYMLRCRHAISGSRTSLDTVQAAENLEGKAKWLMEHIREHEWISGPQGGWYNSYYDNHGRRVEGIDEAGNVRMMLTGQVFSIMAGTAVDEQIPQIVKAADAYLYDENCGGYRLNTDFKELKTDMGRMFGFAFGEKENGAVFSHMAVMYANALYSRGFAKEGYKALNSLYRQSMDFEKSRIYPGIPEYFGRNGRGLYHYLTGAASWYMLTVITQMFGIRGCDGGLTVQPALLEEQFDEKNIAGLELKLLGIAWKLTVENPERLEAGHYQIKTICLDEKTEEVHALSKTFAESEITALDARRIHRIYVTLEAK